MKRENCTRLTARVAELEASLGRMMADNSKLEIRVGELEEFRKFVEKSGMGAGCNEDTCHHYSCHICLIDKARALGQKEGE